MDFEDETIDEMYMDEDVNLIFEEHLEDFADRCESEESETESE